MIFIASRNQIIHSHVDKGELLFDKSIMAVLEGIQSVCLQEKIIVASPSKECREGRGSRPMDINIETNGKRNEIKVETNRFRGSELLENGVRM